MRCQCCRQETSPTDIVWQGRCRTCCGLAEGARAPEVEPECICYDSNLPARLDCPYCYPTS